MNFPRPIRRGNIYWVPDLSVNLPPTETQNRVTHPTRPFLVISDDVHNADSSWLVVMGFPLSTSPKYVTEFDVAVKKGQANLPQDCWVQVDMLQPLAKRTLGDWVGVLDANSVEQCIANLFSYIGLD